MSDGTSTLRYLNPETFEYVRSVEVRFGKKVPTKTQYESRYAELLAVIDPEIDTVAEALQALETQIDDYFRMMPKESFTPATVDKKQIEQDK